MAATSYGVVIMLLKVGILLEWAKISAPGGYRNSFWWTCHVVLGINILFYVASTAVELFQCTPREKLWKMTVPGRCMNTAQLNIVSASVNFASDIIILLLPQKVIWGLQMSKLRKLGVATLFAAGILYVVLLVLLEIFV
jgi:hypothetical protein